MCQWGLNVGSKLDRVLEKVKGEAHTVLSAGAVLSSSWPAASEERRSHKYFQQRYGQHSTPSNLWQVCNPSTHPADKLVCSSSLTADQTDDLRESVRR